MSKGVVYVAYGKAALEEAAQSIKTMRQQHDWPIVVVGECGKGVDGAEYIDWPDLSGGLPGRWAKVCLEQLSPHEHTLYIDADTRIYAKLDIGFTLLDRGADMVMVASRPQKHDVLGHLNEEERRYTLDSLFEPLQLNTGMMFFRKSPQVIRLFQVWRQEWQRYRDKDQGALLRALERRPVRLALLGYPFNSDTGAVVSHIFGRASRGCGGTG